MPTVAFGWIGCRCNRYEIEQIRCDFEKNGYDTVPFPGPADVAVINTCAVTTRAEAKSRRLVRRAVKSNPGVRVVITGCMAQNDPDRAAKLAPAALVVGNAHKHEIFEHFLSDSRMVLSDPGRADTFAPVKMFRNMSRALLKVQEGCDGTCAYCIIPALRGMPRSLPPDRALKTAEALVRSGHREIVLTGTHVGLYGRDFEHGPDLAGLCEILERVDGLERLRITSLEPADVTDSLVEWMIKSSVFAHHLHLPLQAAEDTVLKAMRRPYNMDDFDALTAKLVRNIPDLCIGTDLIAGFPGETEEHFQKACVALKHLPVHYFHVFPFSPRKGTGAFEMQGRPAARDVTDRCRHLRKMGDDKWKKFLETQRALSHMVLIEGAEEPGMLTGRTGNYIRVRLAGPAGMTGHMVRIDITGIEPPFATGKLAESIPAFAGDVQ